MLMDYDYFLDILADNLPKDIQNEHFTAFLKNKVLISLDYYADYLAMTLPSPREEWYSYSSYEEMQNKIVKYMNKF